MATAPIDRLAESPVARSLDQVLTWACGQGYYGYSKFDVFNSPIMDALSLKLRLPRLLMTAAWARMPINLRPLLLTRKMRNPKGIALFALARLRRYHVWANEADLAEAQRLLQWLDDNHNPHFSGKCWGYCHPWQSVHFFAPRHSPNIVVTGNIAYTFLEAYETTGQQAYLDTARSVVDFLLKDLRCPIDTPKMRNIGYVPGSDWGVLNINGLAATILIRTWRHTGEDHLRDHARRLIGFLVDKQHPSGAWHYAWPSESSNVKADNYHTGNKVDWLMDYIHLSGDNEHIDALRRGLDFYREHLFTPEGGPRWRSDRTYPMDIHGSAQGIVSFAKAAVELDPAYLPDARRFATWAIEHMQSPASYFYYQKHRWMTARYTLMRWCNGWMSHGLASLLRAEAALAGTMAMPGLAKPGTTPPRPTT